MVIGSIRTVLAVALVSFTTGCGVTVVVGGDDGGTDGGQAGGTVAGGGSAGGGSAGGGSAGGGSAGGGSAGGGATAGGSGGGTQAGGAAAGGSAGGAMSGGAAGGSAFDAGTGNLEVYVLGDLSPKTFTDGLAGQTPSRQRFGVPRLDLMRGPTDANPVTAFDYGMNGVLVDMLATTPTLAGRAQSSALPAGTYPYGRAQLTVVETTIDATVHVAGNAVPGQLTITSALSDTTVEGTPWPKGRTRYAFNSAFGPVSFLGPTPPLVSGGGGIVEEAGKTFMVFPFSAPYVIDPSNTSRSAATIVYDVYKSFRWQDGMKSGFQLNVFDVDAAAMTTEQVRSFGATGYHTTP